MAIRSNHADFAAAAGAARRGLAARSLADVAAARARIERIGKLSDSLIKWGPFGIGLDGVLAWVPGLGELYSLVAGLYLFLEGVRVRAPVRALVEVASIVLLRTASNVAPVAGGVMVDLFRGHRWSAKILTRAIDETLYVEGPPHPDHPAHAQVRGAPAKQSGKRRVVFLG